MRRPAIVTMLASSLVAASLAGAPHRAHAIEQIDLIAPVDGPVVRHFEPPPTPFSAGHRGIDYGAPIGATVVAAAPGTVAFAGPVGGTSAVSIDHAGGLRTTYSFLAAVTTRRGETVAQGAPIARSGPGHDPADPPELHFGLRRGEEYLDPEPILVASMRANLQRVLHLTA